jgi:hypothetical protein
VASIKAEADRRAANVLPIIREAQKAGATTVRQIAEALNARGVATAELAARERTPCDTGTGTSVKSYRHGEAAYSAIASLARCSLQPERAHAADSRDQLGR